MGKCVINNTAHPNNTHTHTHTHTFFIYYVHFGVRFFLIIQDSRSHFFQLLILRLWMGGVSACKGLRFVRKSRLTTKTSTLSMSQRLGIPLNFNNLEIEFRGECRQTGHHEIQPLGCENLGGTPNPELSEGNVEVFCGMSRLGRVIKLIIKK